MGDTMQSAGRHRLTPHELLDASARLGALEPRDRRFAGSVPAYPPQYDESGYPIRKSRRAGMTERVRRLLRG